MFSPFHLYRYVKHLHSYVKKTADLDMKQPAFGDRNPPHTLSTWLMFLGFAGGIWGVVLSEGTVAIIGGAVCLAGFLLAVIQAVIDILR